MPKLEHVLRAMNAKKTPVMSGREDEILDLLMDGVVARKTDDRALQQETIAEIRNALKAILTAVKSIPKTDLKPVLDSILDNKVEIDLSPVLQALNSGFKGIPKPEKVDLSSQFTQVMQRIDMLSMKIDAIDLEMPEISVNVPRVKEVEREEKEEKKEYDLTVTARNAGGGIKSVRIREV